MNLVENEKCCLTDPAGRGKVSLLVTQQAAVVGRISEYGAYGLPISPIGPDVQIQRIQNLRLRHQPGVLCFLGVCTRIPIVHKIVPAVATVAGS